MPLLMEHQLCPRCRRHGRLLEAPPRYGSAEYYRCDVCGEVWTARFKDSDAFDRQRRVLDIQGS
jgi:transposase-like protein